MRIRSSVNRGDAPYPAQRANPASAKTEGDQRIGAILQREGILTPEDVEQIVTEQAGHGDLFGDVAIATGKLTPEQRDEALLLQADRDYNIQGNLDPMLVAAVDLNDNYVNRIRAIRTKILQKQGNSDTIDMRSCALVGLNCDEELAVIAANLAIVMSRLGTPTLLVDASLHNPTLHDLFRVPNRGGLSSMRTNQTLEELVLPTSVSNLWLLPAGPRMPDKGQAFERETLLAKMTDWRVASTQMLVSLPLRSRDYIPTIGSSLSGFDCVLPIVRKHATRISDLRGLIDRLDETNVPVLGMVIV